MDAEIHRLLNRARKLADSSGTRRDAILCLVQVALWQQQELRALRAEIVKKPKAKPKRKGR